jgi:glycopeptide antibiotics resistance protein
MPSLKISVKLEGIIKRIAWGLFIVYVIYALNLLVFGSLYRVHERVRHYNLIPFKTIDLYLYAFDKVNLIIIFNNLLGNVLVFMPLGFFLALLFEKLRRVTLITLISFLCTGAVEITQFVFMVGSFDVDDLILNTLGGVVGYLVFIILAALTSAKEFTSFDGPIVGETFQTSDEG